MPDIFETVDARYYTFYKELIKGTSVASRLNRHTDEVSEALVDELGAMFLAADTGIRVDIENSASYLQKWIEMLSKDYNTFFRAAKEAECSVGWISDITGLDEAEIDIA